MTVIGEWTTVDKSSWGPGPWQGEPDKIHWIDPETDLDCLMHRGPGGHWCGYVAVTEGHPAFEKNYDDVDVDAHGGLTFASFCQKNVTDESEGVCHVPQPGRPDRVWWLGFDFAHYGDLSPAHRYGIGDERYADRAHVEREVGEVARQLAAMRT